MTDSTLKNPSFKSPSKSKWGQAWWAGAARGVLVLARCSSCQQLTHLPGPMCTNCLSPDIEHIEASGLGTVYSYTVTTRPMHAEFVDYAPYTIGYVKLDEGLTIVTWIQGIDPAPELIGARVRVVFERIDDETSLHRFVPVEE